MYSYARALGVAGLVLGIAVLAVSCGTGEAVYDASGIPVCTEDYDCYHGWLYEPGTRCMNNRCVCPVEGDVQCCKKGHAPDNCDYNCRTPSECEPGEMGIPEAEEEPPPPSRECMAATDCPGPPDKRCGSATCEEGKCGVVITPGPVASQLAGDCKRTACDYTGHVVEEKDPSDYYDDGSECSFDICDDSGPQTLLIAKVVCPETGEGYCFEGECVQCTSDPDCKSSEICSAQKCLPTTCDNKTKDGTETDEDCGGECYPCSLGRGCSIGADCKSKICIAGKCGVPLCGDGVKNNGETDVDCGADCEGKPCTEGKGCKIANDCESGVCWAGACEAPTCTDGVKNNGEDDIDCGGPCSSCP